jgi:deazaflavin-dependent oxidoreductase (nitroreductase family)
MHPVAGRIPGWVLIETKGRRSGLSRTTPAGGRLDGNLVWLVAEHGTSTSWVSNALAEPRVRVLVRGRWRWGVATVLPDDDAVKRAMWVNPLNGLALRMAATRPTTVRVDLTHSARM